MLKKHSQVFEILLVAADLVVVSAAWILSYYLRFETDYLPADKGVPPIEDYLRMLLFVWIIWAMVFRWFGLYKPMRVARRFREVWAVIRANALSLLLLMTFIYLFKEKSIPFSRLVFLIFLVLSTFFTVGGRSCIRVFLRFFRAKGYNLRHLLIVGDGDLATKVCKRLEEHPEYGVNVVGCLSADPFIERRRRVMSAGGYDFSAPPLPKATSNAQLQVIGTYSEIPLILDKGSIDEIIIALPLQDHDQMGYVISLIGDSMVNVRIVPDLHHFIQLGSYVESLDGLPVMSLSSTPLSGFNIFLKRAFDFLVSGLLILLSAPMLILTALAVKISSSGPILYFQERVGLDGAKFNIIKFRTMRTDAESGGARFAIKDDSRVTKLGKFLRSTNLDELPQLFNVFFGQMSLVGPRPERPIFIKDFRQKIPRYMLRHKVQAGMTGWAQVNGWRGNTSIEKRIEHDLYYIENWSLLLDIKIFFLTLFKSFRDQNAY